MNEKERKKKKKKKEKRKQREKKKKTTPSVLQLANHINSSVSRQLNKIKTNKKEEEVIKIQGGKQKKRDPYSIAKSGKSNRKQ